MPRLSPNPRKDRTEHKPVKASDTFAVGETIVHTGIYRVVHAGHRVSHFVVLLSGQNFPRCARCGDHVLFQFCRATAAIHHDPQFRVHLYEIPHPPSSEDEGGNEAS